MSRALERRADDLVWIPHGDGASCGLSGGVAMTAPWKFLRDPSPYLAEPTCVHATAVEVTCDWQPRPFLIDRGELGDAVDCRFAVRAREFECAACGCEVYPPTSDRRGAIPCFPRCTRPFCDCFTADEWPMFARPAMPDKPTGTADADGPVPNNETLTNSGLVSHHREDEPR